MAYVISDKCTKCGTCEPVCPSEAIAEGDELYVIDAEKCVDCGLCEEACPCDAIRMDTGIYEIAADSREKFIVDKEFLLNNKFEGTR